MQSQDKAFARGCQGKIKHPTEEAALLALESTKSMKGLKRKVKLNVYKCLFGEHYHVGRRRKNRRSNGTTE